MSLLIGPRRALLSRRIAAAAAAFSPSDITGLQFWLKADSETYADNDAVGTATDRSGNARDATQGTAGRKPTFKTNVVNGKPVYRFDGGDWVETGLWTLSQACTLVVVCKKRLNDSVQQHVLEDSDSTANLVYHRAASNDLTLYAGTANVSATMTVTNWNIVVAVCNGASSVIWINGTNAASGDPGNRANDKIVVGSRSTVPDNYYDGDVAEVLAYSQALSTADRDNLETHLGAKYAITVS